MIIGISGRKRSGKTSVANMLVEEYGFTAFAFADALKDFVAEALKLKRDFVHSDAFKEKLIIATRDNPLVGISGREVLQNFGTAGRKVFGASFWADLTVKRGTTVGHHFVISDLRYWEEVWAVRNGGAGGIIIRLNRADGAGREDQHASETTLPDADSCYDFATTSADVESTKTAVRRWLRDSWNLTPEQAAIDRRRLGK